MVLGPVACCGRLNADQSDPVGEWNVVRETRKLLMLGETSRTRQEYDRERFRFMGSAPRDPLRSSWLVPASTAVPAAAAEQNNNDRYNKYRGDIHV
jgi:hypothetical protein